MNIVVAKKEFARILGRVMPCTDLKSAMPILSHVLLEATPGAPLRVSATDLYIGASGTVTAEVAAPGSVALPAKDLLERVKAMPDGPIQIVVEDLGKTTLKAVGSPRRYTIHGLSGSEFPKLPAPMADTPHLELPAATLAMLIGRTHFSISADESRPQVHSALFEWAGKRIRMVSTDGHRLTKQEVTVAGALHTATMLIPLKAIQAVKKLVDEAASAKDAAPVTIRHSEPNAFFLIDGMQFSVKLVGGQFPPYQQVIPAESTHSIRVLRAAFADSLRAVALAAKKKTDEAGGGVKLTAADRILRIESASSENGDGFDQLDVDFDGSAEPIGFRAEYILHALDAIDTDEAIFSVSGPLDPAVVRSTDDDGFIGVLMPMRI